MLVGFPGLRTSVSRATFAMRFLVPLLTLALFSEPVLAQGSVGIFDGQTDVGHVRRAGSTSYDPRRQSYTIAGSGQNMWGDHDDFHFVWKRMTGNFIIATRARFIGKGVEPHQKICCTIRA